MRPNADRSSTIEAHHRHPDAEALVATATESSDNEAMIAIPERVTPERPSSGLSTILLVSEGDLNSGEYFPARATLCAFPQVRGGFGRRVVTAGDIESESLSGVLMTAL